MIYSIINIGLVDSILFDNGARIAYVYSMTGEKLKVTHVTPESSMSGPMPNDRQEMQQLSAHSVNTTREYLGGDIEIEGNSMISTKSYRYHFGNGYMAFTPGTSSVPTFYYYTKDHLGNVRSVVTKNHSTNEITEVQQTAYYPFGGIIADLGTGRSVQNHLYNGKELDSSNNLWWYDYGARQYDPTRGQFTNYDQHCESYYNTNPLTYCGNNPISRIDPTGMDWVEEEDGRIQWNPEVTKDNYKEILKKGQIYRGISFERNRIWTNVNVRGNLESGLMQEHYNANGKMTYKNLTPWMDIAIEEMNKDIAETGSNPEITKYFIYTQLSENEIDGDKTPWCAAFANYCLEESQIDGSKKATAFSFKNFGQNLGNGKPVYGSIAIMKYSHVGFVVGMNADGRVIILGGNQGDAINLSPNGVSNVVTYVYPKGHVPTSLPLPKYNIKSRSLTFTSSR